MIKKIEILGVGIHSGKPVKMVVKTSKTPGIWFRRTDLGGDLIPAKYDNVADAVLQNTTIGDKNGAFVSTIEHLMCALCVCGISSAQIDIDGPEVPILDGSAKKFIELLGQGSKGQESKIIIKKEIVVNRSEIIAQMPPLQRIAFLFNNFIKGRRSDGYVKLSPDSRGLNINAAIDYPDIIIGRQTTEFLFDYTDKSRALFLKFYAAARTFGSLHEWEWLKARGMALGATIDNVIALNEAGDGTLNKLHWPDEFVRHKIIDTIGDMFTSGGFIYGRVESYKGSHAMNNLALRKLFSDPANYDII